MGLDVSQISEILEAKPRAKQLQKARDHESRLKFHCETILNKADLPSAYNNFLTWVGGTADMQGRLLPLRKFNRFKQLLTLPVDTVELTESIFSKLNRVFDAEDAYRNIEIGDIKDDFYEFYDPVEYMSIYVAEAVRTGINSVWVADLPAEQTGEWPEPYGYIVDISSVEDILNDSHNNCIWVMFVVNGKEWAPEKSKYLMVYDDQTIRKFMYDDGKLQSTEPVVEFPHGLDYTPARQLWTDKLEKGDFINKKSPITNVLNALDGFLFMTVNKKYMDLGSSYPITAAYQQRSDEPADNRQDNASDILKDPEGVDLMGPGSFVEMPPPLPGETDLMANPIQIISPDVTSLEYHTRLIENKKGEIFTSVVGKEDDRTNDQAKNEMQVMSAVESREEVLMRYKRNLELFEKFSTETLAGLRYDKVDAVSVDYGSEFFLKSLSGLQDDYKKALESGSDPVILEDIKDSIMSYKYRNNPKGRERAKIINDLTPYRDKTLDELIQLNSAGLVDPVKLSIRLNILDLVGRFEREVSPLNVFGEEMKYSNKIKTITEQLIIFNQGSDPQNKIINGTD